MDQFTATAVLGDRLRLTVLPWLGYGQAESELGNWA
jgi:hypothetical protein